VRDPDGGGARTRDVEDFRTEEGKNRELTASISN
jgi:hypothetical protein